MAAGHRRSVDLDNFLRQVEPTSSAYSAVRALPDATGGAQVLAEAYKGQALNVPVGAHRPAEAAALSLNSSASWM